MSMTMAKVKEGYGVLDCTVLNGVRDNYSMKRQTNEKIFVCISGLNLFFLSVWSGVR